VKLQTYLLPFDESNKRCLYKLSNSWN